VSGAGAGNILQVLGVSLDSGVVNIWLLSKECSFFSLVSFSNNFLLVSVKGQKISLLSSGE